MITFFRDRGLWLSAIVLIMVAISLAQGAISYTLAFGPLWGFLPRDPSNIATVLLTLRLALVAALVLIWTLKRKRALFRTIIFANALFTLALIVHTTALIAVLFGSASEALRTLILDVTLLSAANILIFSVWYWVIDPPGVEEIPRADDRWDFLFPQRGNSLPHYQSWVPRYLDYLFIAFTTSFAFTPTDTPPLTRRAKMLMLLQGAISVVTLTGIAGSAINILAGK
jgi:hypothetical protein